MKTEKIPYIKPTRHKHESGYRTFEVGYILKMTDDNKVAEKQVLGTMSDHIHQDYMIILGKNEPYSLNLDLTMDGYIRLFAHGKELAWDSAYAFSSMGLKVVDTLPPTGGKE